jgi:2-keto-4-pentenoate hydratase/2-oxohepta-3-ene-1,7-dioic acid hydratase in catechol pathway
MRLVRVQGPSGVHLARLARIEGRDVVTPIVEQQSGPGRDPLRDAIAAGTDLAAAPAVAAEGPLDRFTLLAPVVAPQKVLAIGLNYRDHANETGAELPKAPILFVKTPNSIVGPGQAITYSKDDSTQVDYEAELAIVIGRRCRRVNVDDALDYVLGYTACNDVSARDAQFADGQWVRGKSFDTFCPLGPWIVTADEITDPQALGIRCRVNGELLQDSSTSEMIFGCAELVSYLSQVITLEPGDVIATGTPNGVGFTRKPPVLLLDGDVVEVDIDGIGALQNTVVVE